MCTYLYWSLIPDCTRCVEDRSNLAWADHREPIFWLFTQSDPQKRLHAARLTVLWKPPSQNSCSLEAKNPFGVNLGYFDVL